MVHRPLLQGEFRRCDGGGPVRLVMELFQASQVMVLSRCLALACGFAVLSCPGQTETGPAAVAENPATEIEWVTVRPEEVPDALNNPWKGFRRHHEHGYGLLVRRCIPWNEIEHSAGDTVERIIAHTSAICRVGGRGFEGLNIKLVPRVYLDWDGSEGSPGDSFRLRPSCARPEKRPYWPIVQQDRAPRPGHGGRGGPPNPPARSGEFAETRQFTL